MTPRRLLLIISISLVLAGSLTSPASAADCGNAINCNMDTSGTSVQMTHTVLDRARNGLDLQTGKPDVRVFEYTSVTACSLSIPGGANADVPCVGAVQACAGNTPAQGQGPQVRLYRREPDASRSSTPGSSPATTAAPSTTSASPTTTTRVDPQLDPSIPAAARLPNHAGALAFVRYFIRRWNLTETGPRPGILTPLCLPSSEACAVYEKEAARLAKAGHRYNGTPITIKSMKIQDAPKARMVDILAVLVQEPSSEVDASGKVYRTAKKKDFGIRFVVLHTGKTWSVNFIQSAQ